MLREVRDGLDDAVTAYRECGVDAEWAAALAVRDFGPLHEVAPQFQDELAARQGRWTAALLTVGFPGMMLGWDLVWRGSASTHHAPPPLLTTVLARVEDAASVLVGAAALVLLALSFSRAASPRRVASLVGRLAVAGALVTTGTAVLMSLANASAASVVLIANPYALPAYVASGLMFVVVMRTALRTLRAAGAHSRET
jgi:hypothetical protein